MALEQLIQQLNGNLTVIPYRDKWEWHESLFELGQFTLLPFCLCHCQEGNRSEGILCTYTAVLGLGAQGPADKECIRIMSASCRPRQGQNHHHTKEWVSYAPNKCRWTLTWVCWMKTFGWFLRTSSTYYKSWKHFSYCWIMVQINIKQYSTTLVCQNRPVFRVGCCKLFV